MTDKFGYKTIKFNGEGIYKEKGSKFLGFTYQISCEEDVSRILKKLKKEYYDARHHCYAFILGAEGSHFRASDGGEPAHTAGDPILGQIRTRELTNVLVVVVRYFGGTKLGASGLINAYRTSAADALDNSGKIEKEEEQSWNLCIEYSNLHEVISIIKKFNCTVTEEVYDDNLIRYQLTIRKVVLEQVKNALKPFDCEE